MFSKCIGLFLCMSVQIDMALTALCRALYLLLCKKLEIPLNAKQRTPEIIVLKILLLFHPLGNLGNIKSTSFFNIWCVVLLQALICIYRTPCMAYILHNTWANLLYFLKFGHCLDHLGYINNYILYHILWVIILNHPALVK